MPTGATVRDVCYVCECGRESVHQQVRDTTREEERTAFSAANLASDGNNTFLT